MNVALVLLGGVIFWVWGRVVGAVSWVVFRYEFPTLLYWGVVSVYVVVAGVFLTARDRRVRKEAFFRHEQNPLKGSELHSAVAEQLRRGWHVVDLTKTLAEIAFFSACLLFVPVVLPLEGVVRLLSWACELRFRSRMRRQGRYMAWGNVARRLEAGEGTLIVAWFEKGCGCWWTDEDVAGFCPHPVCQSLLDVGIYGADRHRSFTVWCHERYLDRDRGAACYTVLPERRAWEALSSGRVVHVRGWVALRGGAAS